MASLTKVARELDIPGATGMRKQELIFEILRARGLEIDAAGEAAILAIPSPERLFARALTVTSLDALLQT